MLHGFSSAIAIKSVTNDSDGRLLVVLYIGDFDPSGLYMSEVDLPKRIEEFVARSKEPRPVAELAFLTDREREVTALVAEGLSNGEIAERLFVSAATVKTHVSRSMTKLQARDRAQLVVMAYESGLVRPGWLAT